MREMFRRRFGTPEGARGPEMSSDLLRSHPLATKTGINLMGALLMGSGAMCPKCCHGTRVTSKRWARCKKCGERVERRKMEDVAAEIREAQRVRP